jgi:hypothetical protein
MVAALRGAFGGTLGGATIKVLCICHSGAAPATLAAGHAPEGLHLPALVAGPLLAGLYLRLLVAAFVTAGLHLPPW